MAEHRTGSGKAKMVRHVHALSSASRAGRFKGSLIWHLMLPRLHIQAQLQQKACKAP